MQITYKLHGGQFPIFNDLSRFVVLVAGRRFGKTVLALVKIITEALKTEKAKIWYVAPTYRQAEMIAWKMLFEMIPAELIAKKNEVKLEITLINGSEIALKGADNEDSLTGVGLDFVVMDEYGTMKAHVWQMIIRPMLADRQGRALFIGTPRGKNHFWELFMRGIRKEEGYASYQMKTADNPYIARSEIKEAQEQMSERFFRQEFEASFEDYTGLIWPEFDQKIHVVDPFVLEPWYEKIGALDLATSGTTAAVFAACDHEGNIIIFGEYYQQNMRVSEIADVIRARVSRWVADPSGQRRSETREGKLYSLYDEYADNGIILRPAENDVDAGINRVAEFFKNRKIKIFSTCKNLIAEIERYHWSEEKETSGGTLKPKPYKSFDHACDALRYLIMSRASESLAPLPRSSDRALPLAGELIRNDNRKQGIDSWLR